MKNDEISMKLAVKDMMISNQIEIIEREKSAEEKLSEHLLKNYVKFFQSNLSKCNLQKKGQFVEIANDDFLTVSDYSKNCIDVVITPDRLSRILDNPIQLKKIDLICAVMPYDDILNVIESLSEIPKISSTKVILGAYGLNENTRDYNYDTIVLKNFADRLDFNNIKTAELNERLDDTFVKSYYKMVMSDYRPNYSKRHF